MLYSHCLLKTDDDGISMSAMVQHEQSDWLLLQNTLPESQPCQWEILKGRTKEKENSMLEMKN